MTDTNHSKQAGAIPALDVPAGSASRDSRLAYIVCHLISAATNLAVFAGIVWLAYTLKSGWVLWALLLCPWSKYKHDFNGVNRSSPNTRDDRRRAPDSAQPNGA
jgi:hypothetical protein